jgi:hypothetical protein
MEDDHQLDQSEREEVVDYLQTLSMTKIVICEGMILAMEYA